jgi:hypothetical protein
MTMVSNGHVADVVEGVVEARNERGVKVAGDWRDVSKFHPVDLPPQGARVHLDLDTKGFIRSVQVLDQVAGANAGPRDHASVRLSVLTAAAAFAAGKAVAGVEVSSADVLKIAEAWERWVLTSNDQELPHA